jgi:phage tail-like protein
MASPGGRQDPLAAFNFVVSFVGGVAAAGFSEASGLEGSMQVEEYSEGGENRYVHKFFTRMTWSNIVLRRGVGLDTALWDWHAQYVAGLGRRRDGMIVLLDQDRRPAGRWIFRRGLPLKWTGPTFNAAQGAVAIESLEIVHEGLELAAGGT